jgi:shikimate kinase
MKFAMRMNILICGFSGSGKSSLLKELKGNELFAKYELVDLDEKLVQNLNAQSVVDIVAEKGWDNFREREEELLLDLMLRGGKFIALGGGSLNINIINQLSNTNSELYWLDTPFATCYERLEKSDDRPLVKRGKNFLTQLYNERLELYQKGQRFQTVDEFINLFLKSQA